MAIINSSLQTLACSGALPAKRTGICALHQRPKKGSFTNYMSSLISLTFRDSPRCCGQVYLGTIHILRHHIFLDFWIPLLPYVSMFLVSRISKNWHFLTPLPPTSADVIYEWSFPFLSNSEGGLLP